MEGGEEFLLRPVFAHLCRYESLIDGTMSLEDVVLLNEALDVQAENEARLKAAAST